MIKAITFDLDDTLWSTADVISRAESTMFGWLDEHCPAFTAVHTPDTFLAARRALIESAPDIAHNLKAIRKLALTQCLQDLGISDASRTAAMATEAFQRARQQVNLFDGVAPALAQLADRYSLAAITNGTTVIDNTPVGTHFAFCLNAEHTPRASPLRICFMMPLAGLGWPRTKCCTSEIIGNKTSRPPSAWISNRLDQWTAGPLGSAKTGQCPPARPRSRPRHRLRQPNAETTWVVATADRTARRTGFHCCLNRP